MSRETIPFWWDMALVAVLSLAIFAWAVRVRLEPDAAHAAVHELRDETEAEEHELSVSAG